MPSVKTLKDLLKQASITNNDVRYMSEKTKAEIISRTPNCTGNFRERIFWLQNNLKEYPICPQCDKPLTSKNFRINFKNGRYTEFCSVKCTKRNPGLREELKATILERYGTEHYLSSKEGRSKIEATNLERYGSKNPHPWESPKCHEYMVKKHGVTSAQHIPASKEKIFWSLVKRGRFLDPSLQTEFEKYKLAVNRETKRQPNHLLEYYDERGREKGCYSLDHKYSKFQGFLDKIDPKIIGNIANLEYIPVSKNCSKSGKCSIEKEELFRLFYK